MKHPSLGLVRWATYRTLSRLSATVCVLAFAASGAAAQKTPQKPPKPLPAPGLALAALAGQAIPVLPTTYVVTTLPTMHPAGLPEDRARRLAWADSIVADQLASRGPAVTWLSADTLRRVYKRSGGMLVDPDRMGQEVMAGDRYKVVFDPLLGNLRRLVAFLGMNVTSRFVMIPAAFHFSVVAGDSVRVEAAYVLADTRSGNVIWRSYPIGTARNAADALALTIAYILPEH